MNTPPPTLSPVRIYVLWHPNFAKGLALARWIYNWLRLETMEGIPVFFRSDSDPGSRIPLPIPHDCKLNYVIPFVEAHMVACPHWRAYVAGFATTGPDPLNSVDRLFPVAMDSVAYQMPASETGPRAGTDAPSPSGGAHSAPAFFIPPVVVVYNMEGKKIGRTIPELGHIVASMEQKTPQGVKTRVALITKVLYAPYIDMMK